MTREQDMMRSEAIARAIRNAASSAPRRDENGRWVMQSNGVPMSMGHSDNGWLRVMAQVRTNAENEWAWHLLQLAGQLAGSAKFAVDWASGQAAVLRDVWLDCGVLDDLSRESVGEVVATLVEEAIQDVHEAIEVLRGGHARADDAPPPAGEGSVDLGDLCQASGWTANRRANGDVAVPLEVPGGHAQAIVRSGDSIRATLELPPGRAGMGGLCADSRQAIGILLLQLAGRLHGVRAVVDATSGAAVLEGRVAPGPAAANLNHLLGALSVAAQLAVRETAALGSPQVAQVYLKVRGWSSESSTGVNPSEPETELFHEQDSDHVVSGPRRQRTEGGNGERLPDRSIRRRSRAVASFDDGSASQR